VATSDIEVAKYLNDIEPEIGDPDSDEELFVAVRVTAFGTLCAGGMTTEKVIAISEMGTRRFKFIRLS
jgi:hypothetical protein